MHNNNTAICVPSPIKPAKQNQSIDMPQTSRMLANKDNSYNFDVSRQSAQVLPRTQQMSPQHKPMIRYSSIDKFDNQQRIITGQSTLSVGNLKPISHETSAAKAEAIMKGVVTRPMTLNTDVSPRGPPHHGSQTRRDTEDDEPWAEIANFNKLLDIKIKLDEASDLKRKADLQKAYLDQQLQMSAQKQNFEKLEKEHQSKKMQSFMA